MGNMSYCRFENTKEDISDCINALQDREISSDREKRKANELLVSILDFCREERIIEDYNLATIHELIEECE